MASILILRNKFERKSNIRRYKTFKLILFTKKKKLIFSKNYLFFKFNIILIKVLLFVLTMICINFDNF